MYRVIIGRNENEEYFSLLILCGIFIVSCDTKGPATRMINMIPFESVEIHGELRERVLQNLNRLEEEKYQRRMFSLQKNSQEIGQGIQKVEPFWGW
mgnify:CR=1 FL=1